MSVPAEFSDLSSHINLEGACFPLSWMWVSQAVSWSAGQRLSRNVVLTQVRSASSEWAEATSIVTFFLQW